MSLREAMMWAGLISALVLALSIKSMMQTQHVATKSVTFKFQDQQLFNAYVNEFLNATSDEDKMMIFKRIMLETLKGDQGQRSFEVGPNKLEYKIIPCDQLKLIRSVMMRYIDCKPLSEFPDHHVDELLSRETDWPEDPTRYYVEEMSLDHAGKLETLFPSFKPDPSSPYYSLTSGPPGSYRIYPLKQEFARQSIADILKANSMESTHGFVQDFVNFGLYTTLKIGSGPLCDANVFYAFNTTEANFSQFPDMFEYLAALIEHGGLIGLRGGSCTKVDDKMPFTMNLDATFIHRNEFPFVTFNKHFYTSPDSSILDCKSSISQTRIEKTDRLGDYATTIKIKMSSMNSRMPKMNFAQTFTKVEFDAIIERLVARYPQFAHLLQSGMTADDLEVIFFDLLDKFMAQSGELNPDEFYYV